MIQSRRRLLLLFVGIVLGAYFGLVLLTYLVDVSELQGWNDIESNKLKRPNQVQQYTLPSLDDVIKSVEDLDLQHVIDLFRKQFEEIPEGIAPVRVVIASTWRSGSTLLAEILSSYPGVYYHYEPLMPYGMKQINNGALKKEVLGLLSSLFECDYSQQEAYLKFAFVNHDMFVRNSRLWKMCSSMPRSKCYKPENLNKLCSLFPVHMMKVVRTRLDVLANLLKNDNTKIIWLVRDPRATMTSRTTSVTWCDSKACKNPGYLCSDLQEDYSTYIRLKEDNPQQIMLVRYEDLAKNPYDKSKEILEFIGLDSHPKVKAYLDDHLNSDEDAPWSTRHDPTKVMKKWMKIMSWDQLARCQFFCRTVMKYLGYRTFKNKREMDFGNAVGLLNVP